MIKRKQFLNQPSLQFRFARFVVLFAFAASMLTAITIFLTTFLLMGEKLANVYPQGRLIEIFNSAYLTFFASLIILLPLIFFFSVYFSHRIAGPLPKIYEAIRMIGSGNFDVKLTLRKHDELKELADVINETAQKLKGAAGQK